MVRKYIAKQIASKCQMAPQGSQILLARDAETRDSYAKQNDKTRVWRDNSTCQCFLFFLLDACSLFLSCISHPLDKTFPGLGGHSVNSVAVGEHTHLIVTSFCDTECRSRTKTRWAYSNAILKHTLWVMNRKTDIQGKRPPPKPFSLEAQLHSDRHTRKYNTMATVCKS